MSLDQVFVKLLDVLSRQPEVEAVTDLTSIGSGFGKGDRGKTKELIAHTWQLDNPRQRILYNPVRKADVGFSCAQTLWILSKSNEIDPIAFYNPRGRNLSDDGITIYGAYGNRLFGELNQITSCIAKLREDKSSRRACATIWQPADATIPSKDIPCTFAIQFLIRNDKLNMITFMRSQSAVFVLPYDVFFFTILQELIAAILDVGLGTYYHTSGSVHFYRSESLMVNRIIHSKYSLDLPSMPPMPKETDFDLIQELVEWEQNLRTVLKENEFKPAVNWILKTTKEFNLVREFQVDKYWRDFTRVIGYVALQSKELPNPRKSEWIYDLLPDYYQEALWQKP